MSVSPRRDWLQYADHPRLHYADPRHADDLAAGMALLNREKLAIVEGGADGGVRSEALYAVLSHMVLKGATDAQIVAVLTHPDNGISAKVLGKQRPAAWLVPQIAKKRAEVGKESPADVAVGSPWPAPQALAAQVAPEPYPLDALPATLRAAVEEVQGFVQAPAALVASSALAALSVAVQSHVDVKRLEKLQGPVALFLLTVADSGERKSTCDGFFTAAIRAHDEEQAEAARPELARHEAEIDAWNAERDGLLAAIRSASTKNKPAGALREALAELQRHKPEAPRIAALLAGDCTPEALAYRLAKQWPAAGVLSSEAGLILGAHAMGRDSAMRNLALLNVLWDGGTHRIGRRTSESFTVKGARLTLALQVQEATLRDFLERSGALARGSGWLARFLVAWPESTQGRRALDAANPDGPGSWPALSAFNQRIAALLAAPAPIAEDGSLTPPLLCLTPKAKAAWVALHNAIEGELRSGGELADVRDVASKAADNAARLAALFEVFARGMGGNVGADVFEGAARIAAWHLNEARRFYGELALPAELADAARLDVWLLAFCREQRTAMVATRDVQRLGPGSVRDRRRLGDALHALEELDRVRVAHEGRRKLIRVNPALLGPQGAL